MLDNYSVRRFGRRDALIASSLISIVFGVLLGTFLIAPLFFPRNGNPPTLTEFPILTIGGTASSYIAGAFDSKPKRALRLIQAIGILLPLFTGLLRYTTHDQSNVSETVNNYLLIGILSLVVSGIAAALGGILTSVAGVLKGSLLFVLVTFVVIGVAAIVMFGETEDPDTSDSEDEKSDTEEVSESRPDDRGEENDGDEVEDVPESSAERDETEVTPSEPDSEGVTAEENDEQL